MNLRSFFSFSTWIGELKDKAVLCADILVGLTRCSGLDSTINGIRSTGWIASL